MRCRGRSLRELAAEGFDVQAHSKTHGDLRRIAGEPDAQYQRRMQAELAQPQELFQKNLGRRADIVAFPYGSWDESLLGKAIEHGYVAAFSVRRQGNGAFIRLLAGNRSQIYSEMTLDDFAKNLNVYQRESLVGAHEVSRARVVRAASLLLALALGACATTGERRSRPAQEVTPPPPRGAQRPSSTDGPAGAPRRAARRAGGRARACGRSPAERWTSSRSPSRSGRGTPRRRRRSRRSRRRSRARWPSGFARGARRSREACRSSASAIPRRACAPPCQSRRLRRAAGR